MMYVLAGIAGAIIWDLLKAGFFWAWPRFWRE
jgi:hypothetical protein